MKPLFFFPLILLFSLQVNAQDNTATYFTIGHIPPEGLVLDKGWVYHSGDDPAWARPGFNDSSWKIISPVEEIHHLPEVRDANPGWFRLKLKVDSIWFGKPLALLFSGLGAQEIFLNGHLIYRYGIVSQNFEDEKTRYFTNNLLSLTLEESEWQTIAIRYSLNKRNLYLKFAEPKPIAKMMIKEINQGFSDHIKDTSFDSTLRTLQVSFYLPLGFLLLFLFFSFRSKKEYLYSGIFCFSLFAAILVHIFALSEPTTVSRSNYLLMITQVFYVTGAFCFINAVYILYNLKKNFFYYFIIIYGLWSLPYYFISYDASGLFNAFFFPIINTEFLRLNILGVRRGRKGAWILLATSIIFTITILLYIWFTISHRSEFSALLQSISFMVPGIGFSFFYASEFARNAVALQIEAIKVKKLSDEMIESEREKQQILSDQNETLERQVTERTAELRQSLKDLRDAEQQLIQREKMASLGELTGGIAHEIQNPLNFVNNFSDVNTELIDEANQEIEKGNTDQVTAILKDLKDNEQKINHHGKRAGAIVKAMLLHSRASSGQKEPTDINALADEYLRLAYHGSRAKDKSFDAITSTEFDSNIGKVNVIPQEFGRVILNLINNAFYACAERSRSTVCEKSSCIKASEDKQYEPTVTVSTTKANGKVEIRVKDNGNGIPQKNLDKIFQPFFTTKPAGQGTGLGLSLAYDIITKGHGGELKVETKEGEGSEFTIQLPFGT